MAIKVAVPEIPQDWRVLHARSRSALGIALNELALGTQRVIVNDADLGNPGARLFADAMLGQKSLRNLNLGGNRIGDDGCIRIAKAMMKHPMLQVVALPFNFISDEGAVELAKVVQAHGSLKLLNLEGNSITDRGASA